MVIKANCRKAASQLASYLLTETQQKAYLIEHRGSAVDDLRTMLKAWEQEAYATSKRAEKPLYHLIVRLSPGEALKRDQWMSILESVEEKLKLSNQPRAIVGHVPNGQELHLHVVYSRLNTDRGTLVHMGHDRKSMHDVARAKEREYGLRVLESKRQQYRSGNQKTRSVEHRMAKEAGTTRRALCGIVKAAWEASSTGQEFQQFLSRYGMTLTTGERRPYNLIHEGKKYNPVRLLENINTPEFRRKMEREATASHQPSAELQTPLIKRQSKELKRGGIRGEQKPELPSQEGLLSELNRRLTQQRQNKRGLDLEQ